MNSLCNFVKKDKEKETLLRINICIKSKPKKGSNMKSMLPENF